MRGKSQNCGRKEYSENDLAINRRGMPLRACPGSGNSPGANEGLKMESNFSETSAGVSAAGGETRDGVLCRLLEGRHSCRAFLPQRVGNAVFPRILEILQRT